MNEWMCFKELHLYKRVAGWVRMSSLWKVWWSITTTTNSNNNNNNNSKQRTHSIDEDMSVAGQKQETLCWVVSSPVLITCCELPKMRWSPMLSNAPWSWMVAHVRVIISSGSSGTFPVFTLKVPSPRNLLSSVTSGQLVPLIHVRSSIYLAVYFFAFKFTS